MFNKSHEHINKIVVIGAGNVGQAIAYTLLVRKQANDIVIIDVRRERARSAAHDIAHAIGFFTQITVRDGDYDECKNADMVIITAGIGRKAGQSRLDLAHTNIEIMKKITGSIMRYNSNPMIIVVTNPVDIITAAVLKEAGIESRRVMGSGTTLDTARFRYVLSEKLDVGVEDVSAYVIGEHGDSHVPVWSQAHISGIPMSEYEKQTGLNVNVEKIEEYIRKSGADIIAGKGATFYGIAMAVSNIIGNLMNDRHVIMPISNKLDDSFGDWEGAVISMPCMLGRDGVERIINIPLDESEKERMDTSVSLIKKMQSELGLL